MITAPSHKPSASAGKLRPDDEPSPARAARVMYVVSDLSVGGAEMMLYKLLAGTDRARFEPSVISLMGGGSLAERVEALGVKVHALGVRPELPTPLDLWRLVRLIRRERPDLVVGWMYHSCLAVQLAAALARVPVEVLWSIHYSVDSLAEEKRRTALVIRACALLSGLPQKIVFVSRDGRSKHGPLGFKTGRGCVIPNGIDARTFAPSAEARASVRAELGLSADALIIGMIGRYHRVKDHANFLRAAARVSEAHLEANFLLAGRGVDDDNRELGRLVEELRLAGRVHLLGERQDVPRLAAALDVFTLSSRYGESFPNVIGEAMACGVPCVVTNLGDAAWIVGETGRVVPPGDHESLAGAWSEMIALGAEGRAALGRAALSRVAELFPVESVVRRYESLYEAVLAGRAHEPAAALVRRDQKPGVVP